MAGAIGVCTLTEDLRKYIIAKGSDENEKNIVVAGDYVFIRFQPSNLQTWLEFKTVLVRNKLFVEIVCEVTHDDKQCKKAASECVDETDITFFKEKPCIKKENEESNKCCQVGFSASYSIWRRGAKTVSTFFCWLI